MGEIKNYTCDCGYSKDFFAGAGMRALNMPLAKQFFEDELRQLEDAGLNITSTFLDNALAKCPACRALESISRVSCETSDGVSHIFVKDVCQACGQKMQVLENEEDILCPKCGMRMKSMMVGNWD